MFSYEHISLPDFSIFPNPQGQHLMVILKAYLDNSGDEQDSQHKVCSLAGYITNINKWRKFEKLWKQTLAQFNVPYLHMKEFAHNINPFERFKDNEGDKRQFIQSLGNIMEDTNLSGIISVVRLGDLKRFNNEFKLEIDALTFNLYVCMAIICSRWGKQVVEVIIDRMNKPGAILDKAKRYIETDRFLTGYTDYIHVNVLDRGITFRKILPMQAADFIAWETRKNIDTNDEWFGKFKKGNDVKEWKKNIAEWSKQKGIVDRKSFDLLKRQTKPFGYVWNYEELCALHTFRNHNWPS